ncbi:MAG: permease-like cell division protein FtsX [Cyclobacteriaceae bacterium]|nr:permease-like cell division protein FtsX [Cyclobacteriaceae bacterium]
MKNTKKNKKKRLGSYPSLNVIFSVTLALFVIGLFGMLFLHTAKLSEIIRENIEIQIYLNNNVSESQRITLQQTLASKPFTLLKENEAQIDFISKEEAAEIFMNETGEDINNVLSDNPLRDAFTLKVNEAYYDQSKLQQLKDEIETLRGVFEVVYVESLIDLINKNITKISLILLGFTSILLLVVVILINNTIKLALFSQRFLIRSMQLVGAKSSFIRKPFLYRSSLYGLIGGVLASILLFSLTQYAYKRIEDLQLLQDINKMMILFGLLLVLGIIIGFFSTLKAINKYLKMSLDDLY